jgi:hypothetical protein
MQDEDPGAAVERLVKVHNQLIKDLAIKASAASLLAEHEKIGELVMLSLMDDELPYSDLWARLKMISNWLKETEERYKRQFPDDFPKIGNRYDLSRKPDGFKNRGDIFKEIAEQAESNKLWDTNLVLFDPVFAVVKKLRGLVTRPDVEAP